MERRVERIVAAALGRRRPARAARIGWSGTFHAIGARLLRDARRMRSGSIPPSPSTTASDAADLHEPGAPRARPVRQGASAFPRKATCLAIYSRAVNAGEPLEAVLLKQFPWCAEWKDELRELFAAYVEAKQTQQRARLRRSAALLGAS